MVDILWRKFHFLNEVNILTSLNISIQNTPAKLSHFAVKGIKVVLPDYHDSITSRTYREFKERKGNTNIYYSQILLRINFFVVTELSNRRLSIIRFEKKAEMGLPKTRRLAEDETEPISFAAIHV